MPQFLTRCWKGVQVSVPGAWVDFCEEEPFEEPDLSKTKPLIEGVVKEVCDRLNQGYSVDVVLDGKVVATYYPNGQVEDHGDC